MDLKEQTEIAYKIVKDLNENLKVATSEELEKLALKKFSINSKTIFSTINILIDAKMVFSFEIKKEDAYKKIDKLLGYVVTDFEIIRNLKNSSFSDLTVEYNEKFNKGSSAHGIIKELFPKINQFNNTPLGFALNQSIMLSEYEELLEKEYLKYTKEEKTKNLNNILESEKAENEKAVNKEIDTEKLEKHNKRAEDSKEYENFKQQSRNRSISSILNIYGIDFFFRANLRRYQFKVLITAIEERHIYKKSDLQLLKKLLNTINDRMTKDPKLIDYFEEINLLNRTVSRYMIVESH